MNNDRKLNNILSFNRARVIDFYATSVNENKNDVDKET